MKWGMTFGYVKCNLYRRFARNIVDTFRTRIMMYPFMTLEDGTEIVHSEMKDNGEVKVYIETPDEEDGFHHMTCSYRIEQ